MTTELVELLREALPFVDTCPDLFRPGGDELAERIKSAIASRAGGWRTIDSVPNDKIVLLWMPDFEMYAESAWKGKVSWCSRDLQPVFVKLMTPLTMYGKQLWIDISEVGPTHWQPLPELPAAPEPVAVGS